jgi:hypothetical protein
MSDINNSLYRVLSKFKTSFGLSSILPGSKLHSLAESIAFESTITEDMINTYIQNNSLMTATGPILNDIGRNFFGMKRLEVSKPEVTSSMKCLKFYTNNGVAFGDINKSADGLSNNIVIPIGTLITGTYNNIEYVFRMTEEVVLNKATNIGYASATMSMGNNKFIPSGILTSHNFTKYSGSASKLLLVTNATSIGTGREEESDDNYRYRLINSLKSNSTCSYFGIKNRLLEIPGISNIEIVNGAYGGGSFAVYAQGTSPITSDSIIKSVNENISNMVPAWCTYTVSKPNYVGLVMTFAVNSGTQPLSDNAIQSINNAISENVNNFYGSEYKVINLQQIAAYASSEVFGITLTSLQIYTGSGDFRLYEEANLAMRDYTIYLSNIEKLIIEPNIVEPIKIVQV